MLQWLLGRRAQKTGSHCAYPRRRGLSFEPLEDRRMLATFTITNLGDAPVAMSGDAPGTLRQAIFDANALPGADLIEFDSALSGTVSLLSADDTEGSPSALLVSSQITIRGNANGITLQRDSSVPEMRLFRVLAGAGLTLESLMLTGGVARGANGAAPGEEGIAGRGGAVLNEGTLDVVASTLFNNQAIGGNATNAPGGRGLGGAIANDHGTLSIKNATLSGNMVTSGTGSVSPSSFGGGVHMVNGLLTIHNSTITSNIAAAGKGVYIISVAGTATADVQSSIIAQHEFSPIIRDFVAVEDTGGSLSVTGSHNLIRSHDISYPGFTIDDPQDPLLEPLANNGGPTITRRPLSGSQAIDNGNNLLNLATDQRGPTFARVVGSAADIGAFEVQLISGPALPGDYNRNNVVDAADYVLWHKTLGSGVDMFSGADGSGNSTVDPDDYDVWTTNFGETLPAGSGSAAFVVQQPVQAAVATAASENILVAAMEGSPERESSSTTLAAALRPIVPAPLGLTVLSSKRDSATRHREGPTDRHRTLTLPPQVNDRALLAVIADRDRVARSQSARGKITLDSVNESPRKIAALDESTSGTGAAAKLLAGRKRGRR
jgi:hypothetical protein